MIEAGVYLLPARFDESELPGLLPDVVAADAGDEHAARHLVDLLAGRGDLEEVRARADVGDGSAEADRPTMMPAARPQPQTNPPVSKICSVLEPRRPKTAATRAAWAAPVAG